MSKSTGNSGRKPECINKSVSGEGGRKHTMFHSSDSEWLGSSRAVLIHNLLSILGIEGTRRKSYNGRT